MRQIVHSFVCLIIVFLLSSCDNTKSNTKISNQPSDPVSHDADTPPVSQPFTTNPFHLVMLGDSITAGLGLPTSEALPAQLEHALQASGHHILVINAGVSGDTTADALNRFDWSVGPEAEGILIALGGNDILQGIDPDETQRNLEQLINRAKERELTVMLAGMRIPGNYGTNFQARFNAIYPSLAKTHNIAFFPFLLEGVATNPDYNQRDGIHPNKKGVTIIVRNLAPFVAKAIDNHAH